jgi:hypothetical protein
MSFEIHEGIHEAGAGIKIQSVDLCNYKWTAYLNNLLLHTIKRRRARGKSTSMVGVDGTWSWLLMPELEQETRTPG